MRALIFGGSSGIGLATARLARETPPIQGSVTIADIKPPEETPFAYVECDIRSEADIEHAFVAARPDMVIVTAGLQRAQGMAEMTSGIVRELVDVNLLGPMQVVRYAEKHMSSGSVTLVSSIAGLTSGGPGLAAYGATKAAVIGFTRSAALDLAPNLRINCVCPGWTDTPFNDPVIGYIAASTRTGSVSDLKRQLTHDIPRKRMATADEIADAVLFAARNPNLYGAVIVCDGGLSV